MSTPVKAGPSPSVLVVDDLADQADSLAAVLSLYGFAVRVAYSGADALRQAAAEPPDVVLTDLVMNGMDGWELAPRRPPAAGGRAAAPGGPRRAGPRGRGAGLGPCGPRGGALPAGA